jgi:hypothetical protein
VETRENARLRLMAMAMVMVMAMEMVHGMSTLAGEVVDR